MGGTRRRSSDDSNASGARDPKAEAFVEACAKGELRKVHRGVKGGGRGFEVDCTDGAGLTGLMAAAREGQLEVVKLLVAAGAGLFCQGPSGDPHNAFCHAARVGKLSVVKYFVEEIGIGEEGMNKPQGRSGRRTALDYALSRGEGDTDQTPGMMDKYQVCAYLTGKGAKFGEGVTDPAVVFGAVSRGDAYYCLYCCVANATMANARHGQNRETLLHYSCRMMKLKCVQVLLTGSARANIDARDDCGLTPLMVAAGLDDEQIVATLLHLGADPSLKDKKDRTALHYACRGGNINIVKFILAKRKRPQDAIMERDTMRWTPLMAAFGSLSMDEVMECTCGIHTEVVRYLNSILDGIRSPQSQSIAPMEGIMHDESYFQLRALSSEVMRNMGPDTTTTAAEAVSSALTPLPLPSPNSSVTKKNNEEVEEESKSALTPRSPLHVMREASTGMGGEAVSEGSLRLKRFLSTMDGMIWGFSEKWAVFMKRQDILEAEGELPTYESAVGQGLLFDMAGIGPTEEVLFVSAPTRPRFNPEDRDGGYEDEDTLLQVQCFLRSPLGEGIKWIWCGRTCVSIEDIDSDISLEQKTLTVTKNLLTVIARSTHFLAVPRTKAISSEDVSADGKNGAAAAAETHRTRTSGEVAMVGDAQHVSSPPHGDERAIKAAGGGDRRKSSTEILEMQRESLPGGEFAPSASAAGDAKKKKKKKKNKRSDGTAGKDALEMGMEEGGGGRQVEGGGEDEKGQHEEEAEVKPIYLGARGRYSDVLTLVENPLLVWASAAASLMGVKLYLSMRWGEEERGPIFKEVLHAPLVHPGSPGVEQGTGYRGAIASAISDAVRAGQVNPTFWKKVVKALSLSPATEPKVDPIAETTASLANTLARMADPEDQAKLYLKAVMGLFHENLELEVLSDTMAPLTLLKAISIPAVRSLQDCFHETFFNAGNFAHATDLFVNLHLLLLGYVTGTLVLSCDSSSQRRPLFIRYQDALRELDVCKAALESGVAALEEEKKKVNGELGTARARVAELEGELAQRRGCSCIIS